MLEKIKQWLLKPALSTADKIVLVAAAFVLTVLYLNGVILWLNTLHAMDNIYIVIFYGCIMAPLWEEFAFRVIPISIAKGFGEKFLFPVIFLSSLIFGWGHGNGTNSLLIQGAGGIILSFLYLKTNYNYWAVVALHCAWNVWAYFGQNL